MDWSPCCFSEQKLAGSLDGGGLLLLPLLFLQHWNLRRLEMRQQIKIGFTFMILLSVVAVQAFAAQPGQQAPASPPPNASITGRWRVSFAFSGDVERHLVFESQAKGLGSFLLLDTKPDNKPEPAPLPALWSQLTNDRISLAGEVELPLGTCCREMGTLIFKGRFNSNNSISGKLIFVTSVEEEENPYKYRSKIGTFTATRVPAGS
jgi:hypothetical protein